MLDLKLDKLTHADVAERRARALMFEGDLATGVERASITSQPFRAVEASHARSGA